MNYSLIQKLLSRPIAFHSIFAQIAGSLSGGVFLSQLYYWSDKASDPLGFVYKTFEQWHQEIFISRREWESARKSLKLEGLLEEERRGRDPQLWYKLDRDALFQKIADICLKPNDSGNVRSDISQSQIVRQPKSDRTLDLYTENTDQRLLTKIQDAHAKTLDAIEIESLAARRTENIQSGDPENERLPLASNQTAISLAAVPDLLEVQAIAPACNTNPDKQQTKPDPFTTRKNARDYARSRAKEASLFEKGRKNKRWETIEQFKAFQAYIAIYLKNNQQAIEKSSGGINDAERYSQALLWRTATAEDETSKELMCWKTWISDRPPLPIIEPQPQPEPVSDPFSRLAPDLQRRILDLRATVAEQKARKEAERLKWEAKDRAYAS